MESHYYKLLPVCISVHHEMALKNFKFCGDTNSTNIDTVLLPLTVTPPGATSVEGATRQDKDQETFMDYALVDEGNGNRLTLTEAKYIHKCKSFLPNNYNKGCDQLWGYLTIFCAIHGQKHHVAKHLHASIKLFVLHMSSFKKGLINLFGSHLGILKVFHYFHLTMQRWYSK